MDQPKFPGDDIGSRYGRFTDDLSKNQPHISERMQSILVDWFVEVHLKFKLFPETLYLTINLIDRYLTKREVSRTKFQLVGVVLHLFWVASKEGQRFANGHSTINRVLFLLNSEQEANDNGQAFPVFPKYFYCSYRPQPCILHTFKRWYWWMNVSALDAGENMITGAWCHKRHGQLSFS
jgi:Cyclin, N-terminal domain